MYRGNKYCLLISFLLCCCHFSFAQTDTLIGRYIPRNQAVEPPAPQPVPVITNPSFLIGEIEVEGNKRTREHILYRELPFRPGDSISLPELVKGFEIARQQLMNTRLFNEVTVALKAFRGHIVDVSIVVKERWYLFPIPYVKFIDRNLSEWAKQGYATNRLNYGFKLTHYNFTGRNDKLKLWLITGYTKQAQFQYEQPYADKSLKHGYKLGFSYGMNRELNFATEDNHQVFLDSTNGIKRWFGHVDYTYRPGLRTFHAVRFGYHYQDVDTQVIKLNPRYFAPGKSSFSAPELSYSISHYNVDYIPYPLKGWLGEASLMQRGFSRDNHMTQLSARVIKSWPLGEKTWFHGQANGVLRVPFEQPYINSSMLGYGDMYLRGLENYVIDGVGALMIRNTLRRELFSFNIPTFLKSRSHDKVPFRIFAKVYTDAGYVKNKSFPDNSLTNRMLYTTGLGLDVLTFYDFVIKLDYSFNQLGESGFFLHFKNDF